MSLLHFPVSLPKTVQIISLAKGTVDRYDVHCILAQNCKVIVQGHLLRGALPTRQKHPEDGQLSKSDFQARPNVKRLPTCQKGLLKFSDIRPKVTQRENRTGKRRQRAFGWGSLKWQLFSTYSPNSPCQGKLNLNGPNRRCLKTKLVMFKTPKQGKFGDRC